MLNPSSSSSSVILNQPFTYTVCSSTTNWTSQTMLICIYNCYCCCCCSYNFSRWQFNTFKMIDFHFRIIEIGFLAVCQSLQSNNNDNNRVTINGADIIVITIIINFLIMMWIKMLIVVIKKETAKSARKWKWKKQS